MESNKYLTLKGRNKDTWYIQVRVPKHLHKIAKKSFIKQSTKTSDIKLARKQRDEVVGQLKAGGYPRGIGITKDGTRIITANKAEASITVTNKMSNEIESSIEVGINPEFVRVFNDQVFVSTEPSSKGKPPAKGEMNKEEEDDDDDDRTPAKIAVVDLVEGKKIREITAGPETEGIEFSKDGTQIIVTNEADNTITVHDFVSGDLLKTVQADAYGLRPRGIKVSPD